MRLLKEGGREGGREGGVAVPDESAVSPPAGEGAWGPAPFPMNTNVRRH